MSSINPNNIDGTYPIAGQDNDSQGFRDNFTNIKNNLTFAQVEITDLQNNAILKNALAGTTLDNDFNYAIIKKPQILSSVETILDLGTYTTATPAAINWSDALFQLFTLDSSSNTNTTISFANWPTSQLYAKLRIYVIVKDTSKRLTFSSASVYWHNMNNIANVNGYTLTFPATGVYVFEMSTFNSGANVAIVDMLRNGTHLDGNISSTTGLVNFVANLQIGNQGSPISFGNAIVNGVGSANSFVQINIQNLNTVGNLVSADFIATAPNGTDTSNFIDLGINGNNYSSGSWTVSGANDGYLYVNGGSLSLGTDTAGKTVSIHAAGTLAANIVTTFDANMLTNKVGLAESGYQYYNPVGNVAFTANTNVRRMLISPTFSLSPGFTVTLPSGNVEGQIFSISSNVTVSALQVVANPGCNISPISDTAIRSANIAQVSAGSSVSYLFRSAESKWFRIN